MTSPTQRSKKYLQDDGWTVAITERWNSFAKIRQDLFGFIDLVCLAPGVILGVQTTSASNASSRVNKILDEPAALQWIQAGGKILVLAWSKKGPRGKRKAWTATERYVSVEDFMGR